MELNKENIKKILFIIFSSVLFYLLLDNIDTAISVTVKIFYVLSPFIIGLCLAFIINVPLRFFEKKVFKKLHNKVWLKIRRPVCLLISIILIIGIIILFVFLIIPQIKESFIAAIESLPSNVDKLIRSINEFLKKYDLSFDKISDMNIDWSSISKTILDNLKTGGSTVITKLLGITSSVITSTFNTVLGIAFSIYILLAKEKLIYQIKKLLFALFNEKTALRIIEVTSLSNGIFSSFIKGQCTEACILGTLCFIGMSIFRMPYAVMISSLVTITALIPIVGAFVGTFVGGVTILLVSPIKALWFVIFIIVLQQIESNFIYPRVVGKSVGLPGMWVLLSVTIGGSLFGVFGMVISVPLCSVLYCLLREFVNNRLKDKKIKNI